MIYSGDNDGSPRNRRAVFASQTFLDEGDTEFYHGVCGGDYAGLWLDGCFWIVVMIVVYYYLV